MLPRYNGVFISSILNDAFFYAEFQFSYFLPSPPPLLPLFLSLQLRKPKIARRRARLTFHFFSRSLSLSLSPYLSRLLFIFLVNYLRTVRDKAKRGGRSGGRGEGMNCRREVWGCGWKREREWTRARGEKERRSEFKDVCTHLLRRSHN